MLKPIVAAALSTVCTLSAAGDLNGIWQHPKDPVWLEVNEAMGERDQVDRQESTPKLAKCYLQ